MPFWFSPVMLFAMQAVVLAERHHREVFKAVIGFVPVQMVHDLCAHQSPTKRPLHYDPVLKALNAFDSNKYISRCIMGTPTAPIRVCFLLSHTACPLGIASVRVEGCRFLPAPASPLPLIVPPGDHKFHVAPEANPLKEPAVVASHGSIIPQPYIDMDSFGVN